MNSVSTLLALRIIGVVKNRIKREPSLYKAMAPFRAWQIKAAYRRTVAHYAARSAPVTSAQLLASCAGTKLKKLRQLNRPPRILYVGTDYLQDTSGIIQALRKVGTTTVFTKTNGEYGQYLPDQNQQHQLYDPVLKELNGRRLLQLVADLARQGERPDILIGQMWAGWMDGSALRAVSEQVGMLVLNIAMDDRHGYWGRRCNGEWTGSRGLIPYVDLVLTAVPESVDWYTKEGRAALFFPEASDPDIFHPFPDLPKVHDVCFVGMRYGIRNDLVMALRQAGVRVAAFGHGWENGKAPIDQVPKLFAQSKIVLGVGTVSHCRDFYTLKMRDFDAPLSGSLYLTHDNLDLYRLFNVGREIVVYSSIQDCVRKTRYFLDHEDEREAIGMRGCDKVVQQHTWTKRFSDLIVYLTSLPVGG